MRIIIFFVLSTILPFITLAKRNDGYSKEEASMVKKLKSTHKTKLKSIELVKCSDGFKYYKLLSNDGIFSIADSLGKVIIPEKYGYTYIKYIEESSSYLEDRSIHAWVDRTFYRVPTKRSFLASKNSSWSYIHGVTESPTFIYDEYGDIRTFYEDNLQELGASLYKVIRIVSYNPYKITCGLVSGDGSIVIPIDYDYISPTEKLGDWYISCKKDDIEVWGVYSTIKKEEIIPCSFYQVEVSDYKCYNVKITEFDELQPYDSSKSYVIDYKDLGEKYFLSKKYDDVIDFYKINDSISEGKIFVNLAYYHLALNKKKDYDFYLNNVKSDNFSCDFCDNLQKAFLPLKRYIIDWYDYYQSSKIQLESDSLSIYKSHIEESVFFLMQTYKEIYNLEDDIFVAISSYRNRRREWVEAQERQKQYEKEEAIRKEKREKEIQRKRMKEYQRKQEKEKKQENIIDINRNIYQNTIHRRRR